MSHFDENRRFIQERVHGVEAITGRLQSDGRFGNQRDATQTAKIWVTRVDNRAELLVWKNGRVNDTSAGVAVIIKFSDGDGWYVDKGANPQLAISHPGLEDTMLAPRRTGDLIDEALPGRLLKPGRVKVWVAGGLKVNAYAFWYLNSDGAIKRWTPPLLDSDGTLIGTDTCLNLAAYVPASSQKAWVVVDFNPDATSPAFVATSATLRPLAYPGTPPFSDIEAVPLTDGYIRLWAFLLVTGATTESDVLPMSSFQEDLRFWQGFSGGGDTVTTLSATATPTGIFDIAVTNPTTTPAIALSLDTQTANTFLGGPTSGSAAIPSFRTIKASQLSTRIEPLMFNGELLTFNGDMIAWEVAA